MNPDFARYQKLPRVDVQSLSAHPALVGNMTSLQEIIGKRPLLFPLPKGEGQGEGEAAPQQFQGGQQLKSSRT